MFKNFMLVCRMVNHLIWRFVAASSVNQWCHCGIPLLNHENSQFLFSRLHSISDISKRQFWRVGRYLEMFSMIFYTYVYCIYVYIMRYLESHYLEIILLNPSSPEASIISHFVHSMYSMSQAVAPTGDGLKYASIWASEIWRRGHVNAAMA